MKTNKEKLEYLKSLAKETDIHALLKELLPEMGYLDVKITHEKGSNPEFGKDVVCSLFDNIEGKKDWLAFVVKKGAVSGRSGVVAEIESQIKECFKYPYKSLEQRRKLPIAKVKVVTNEHFASGAKDKIYENEDIDKAHVDFWDGERLIKLIDEHYPKFWIAGSKQYKKYVEKLQERIKVDNLVKTLGLNDKKVERVLNNLIEPKLSERIELDDGSIEWKPRKASTIIDIPENAMIVGEPGSGKSTLFKSLSSEIVLQNSLRNHSDFYPIIITFKEIKSAGFNVEKAIEAFFTKGWVSDLEIDHVALLKTQSCAVFIDALDELPLEESKDNALDAVAEFRETYPDIRVICSSRPSEYIFHNCDSFGFRYLSISPLNMYQVEAFFNNYFAENIIKSKSLLKSLRDSGILERLPKTPMTIALITILFDERDIEIPSTITDLYEHFVNLLIGKSTSTSAIELIESGIKHRLLCNLANRLHSNLNKSCEMSDLVALIEEFSEQRGQNLDAVEIAKDLVENIGLLYKNEKGRVSFKHLSFQEYFTAYEIFHHRQENRQTFTLNFNDLWWQNVAIFYAGMTKDAPELLEKILEKSKPINFTELITNTGGVGKLLQALYNTPIEQRKKGIERGVENTVESLNHILDNSDDSVRFWYNFSKFGLMQIFGGWFKMNNYSITLKEPLIQQFEEEIDELLDSELTEKQVFEKEFRLFLISSLLATDDFISFEKFRELMEKARSADPNLIATYDVHMKLLRKYLPKEFRKDKDLRKIEKKIAKRLEGYPDLSEQVNVSIKESKKKLLTTQHDRAETHKAATQP